MVFIGENCFDAVDREDPYQNNEKLKEYGYQGILSLKLKSIASSVTDIERMGKWLKLRRNT